LRDISKISAVEPRADVDLARVRAKGAEGADEHVLQHVLGVLPAVRRQHLPDVREQTLPVAVMEHAEGVVRAGAEQRDELLVGAQPQQRRRQREPGQARRRV
jgi:hypothetical protein